MLRMMMAIDGENFYGQNHSSKCKVDFIGLRDFMLNLGTGRSLVQGVAYLPLPPNGDPKRKGVRRFHRYLRKKGFRVVVKEAVRRPDGPPKANVDTDLVVDVIERTGVTKTDVVVVVSGDGDFAPLCQYLRKRSIWVEVASLSKPLSPRLRTAANTVIDLKPYFESCQRQDPEESPEH